MKNDVSADRSCKGREKIKREARKQLSTTAISTVKINLPHYLRNISIYLLFAHNLKLYILYHCNALAMESNGTNCAHYK